MRLVTLAAGLGLSVLPAVAANAAAVTFNFNTTAPPQSYFNSQFLTNGQVLTPDIGDATQKATVGITDPINPNQAFQLEDGPSAGYGPGLVLESVQDSSSILKLTFTRPVYTVNFDFGVIYGGSAGFPAPPTDQNSLTASAFLTSSSPSPFTSVSSGGGVYNATFDQYFGHLTLSSQVSFTTVSFGLSNTTLSDTMALDNIVADDTFTVPEPGAIALGVALALPAAWRLRRRKRAK